MSRLRGAALALVLIGGSAGADDRARARLDYMLHCQGCHLADGAGFEDRVPRMKDFVGYFLHSAEGRAFLIRVPGVAFAPLPSEQISELMNWMLVEFSADQLPRDFDLYTAQEVAALRVAPETDPMNRRAEILANLGLAGIERDGHPAAH